MDVLKNDYLQFMAKSNILVTANGELVIVSGGESASQGGMGSGSKSGKEKGEIQTDNNNQTDQKKDADIETENTFDPLKEEIEKKEQEK